MLVTRTYLELPSRAAFRPAPHPPPPPPPGGHSGLQASRVADPAPTLYRELYREVGRDYHWRDRWDWSDAEIAAHLAHGGIHLYLALVGDARAGFYELKEDGDGSVEIAYFGLLPGFLGRGLGKQLLSLAVGDAYTLGARRVWLHTCTLDHPAALPNYRARGFVPYKTEQYEVETTERPL